MKTNNRLKDNDRLQYSTNFDILMYLTCTENKKEILFAQGT